MQDKQDKQQIVEDILARFYENRVTKVSKDGKKIDVKLIALDERLAKNINLIVTKLNYKVSKDSIANEQIYTMYSVLIKEVNGVPKFTNEQLLSLNDLDIVNLTIKHLKFNDYKLLETEVKRQVDTKKKTKEYVSLNPVSLDKLIQENNFDLVNSEGSKQQKLSEFMNWFSINKYTLLSSKQLYFLQHTGSLLDDTNILRYKNATEEYMNTISTKHRSAYSAIIDSKITVAYAKYKKSIAEKTDVELNVDSHFNNYFELYENENYTECLDLLVKVVRSCDLKLNEKVTVKNKYAAIEDLLSDKMELKHMQQILKYEATKSTNDVKQSTLNAIYKILQEG